MPAGHSCGFNWDAQIAGSDGPRFELPEDAEVRGVAPVPVEYFSFEHVRNAPSGLYSRSRGLSTAAYQGAYYGVSAVDTSIPADGQISRVMCSGVVLIVPSVVSHASADDGRDDMEDTPSLGGDHRVAVDPVLTPALRLEAVREFLL